MLTRRELGLSGVMSADWESGSSEGAVKSACLWGSSVEKSEECFFQAW